VIGMFYVISYDVSDDKKRRKLAKYLESYGVRVQYSVFETELNDTQVSKMIRGIQSRIDKSTDTVRIYAIPKDFRERIVTIGENKGQFYDDDYIIV